VKVKPDGPIKKAEDEDEDEAQGSPKKKAKQSNKVVAF